MTVRSHSLFRGMVVLVAAALLSGRAYAQGAPNASASADAEALIDRGFELRQKGDDQAALVQFQDAYALSKSARALAQIALAEQALGHWADAEAHLAWALQQTDAPWITKNRALLEPALTEIQGHVGSLELTGGVVGAQVFLNGALAGTFPLQAPIRVPAGNVALEVHAPGYLPVVRTVIVQARGLARESVVMYADASAAGYQQPVYASPPPSVDPPSSVVSQQTGFREGPRFGLFLGGIVIPSTDASAAAGGAIVTFGSKRVGFEPRLYGALAYVEDSNTKTTAGVALGHGTYWWGIYGLGFGVGLGYAGFTRKNSYGWNDNSGMAVAYVAPVMLRFGRRPTFEIGLNSGATRFFSHDLRPYGYLYGAIMF
jgi:hypothetical protein